MISNDYICTQVGDTIIMDTTIMLNITTLTGYTDSVTGETGIRMFEREFKYSLDGGVKFSEWMVLNNGNLLTINQYLTNICQLVFRFKYKRIGIDTTGQIELNSININGTQVLRATSFNISNRSIYKDYIYNNVDVMNLMVNLTQKMYADGIVPKYLIRNEETEESDITIDEDYIDYWQTISTFYSVILIDNLKFENIYWKRNLLHEYLKQKGIFTCNSNDIIELQLIAQSYLTEIKVRGTEEIFKPKNYEYQIGYRNIYALPDDFTVTPSTPVQIDGIEYKEVKFLPFGWTVQNTSLVAPDRNYHHIRYFNVLNSAFDLQPSTKSILFPTQNSGILKRFNGEYLRLICYNEKCDEFIYNNVPKQYVGWCLGNSSPLYRGLRPQRNKSLLKAYEKQHNVQDLSKYPIINPSQVFIGIAKNPLGAEDTVMYISSDGNPCFADVIPQLLNVSKYLTLVIAYKANSNIVGSVTLTNTLNMEAFVIPIEPAGDGLPISIETNIVPARYSVAIDVTFVGKLGGKLDDGAALQYDLISTNGGFNQLFTLDQVGSDNINLQLNFI